MFSEYHKTRLFIKNYVYNIICLYMITFGSLRATYSSPKLGLIVLQPGVVAEGECLSLTIQQLK